MYLSSENLDILDLSNLPVKEIENDSDAREQAELICKIIIEILKLEDKEKMKSKV